MIQVTQSLLVILHISTTGYLFMLIASLLFALNVFAMTFIWKMSLFKLVFGVVTAPLDKSEARA